MLALLYLVAYIDKTNIGLAAIYYHLLCLCCSLLQAMLKSRVYFLA